MSIYGTNIAKEVDRLPDHKVYGQVTDVIGLLIEAAGVQSSLSVGDHCKIITRDGRDVRLGPRIAARDTGLPLPRTKSNGMKTDSGGAAQADHRQMLPDLNVAHR